VAELAAAALADRLDEPRNTPYETPTFAWVLEKHTAAKQIDPAPGPQAWHLARDSGADTKSPHDRGRKGSSWSNYR